MVTISTDTLEDIITLLGGYTDELAAALREVTLEEDEESLQAKVEELENMVTYLEDLRRAASSKGGVIMSDLEHEFKKRFRQEISDGEYEDFDSYELAMAVWQDDMNQEGEPPIKLLKWARRQTEALP